MHLCCYLLISLWHFSSCHMPIGLNWSRWDFLKIIRTNIATFFELYFNFQSIKKLSKLVFDLVTMHLMLIRKRTTNREENRIEILTSLQRLCIRITEMLGDIRVCMLKSKRCLYVYLSCVLYRNLQSTIKQIYNSIFAYVIN